MEVFQPVAKQLMENERRANDSLVVLLMQEVHKKIEDIDRKLSEHMTNETITLAQEIAKLINTAFPGNDPQGHKAYHEIQMQAIADRAEFWKTMRTEISKWGLIGFVGWVVVTAWKAFIMGPLK
jgi:predicted metal-dependent hydrolase